MTEPQDYFPWPINTPPDITLFTHLPTYDLGDVFSLYMGPGKAKGTKKIFTIKSVETSIHPFMTLYHGTLIIEKASLFLPPGVFKGSSETYPYMIYENILKKWDQMLI